MLVLTTTSEILQFSTTKTDKLLEYPTRRKFWNCKAEIHNQRLALPVPVYPIFAQGETSPLPLLVRPDVFMPEHNADKIHSEKMGREGIRWQVSASFRFEITIEKPDELFSFGVTSRRRPIEERTQLPEALKPRLFPGASRRMDAPRRFYKRAGCRAEADRSRKNRNEVGPAGCT